MHASGKESSSQHEEEERVSGAESAEEGARPDELAQEFLEQLLPN